MLVVFGFGKRSSTVGGGALRSWQVKRSQSTCTTLPLAVRSASSRTLISLPSRTREFFFARAGRVMAGLRCYPRDYHRGCYAPAPRPAPPRKRGPLRALRWSCARGEPLHPTHEPRKTECENFRFSAEEIQCNRHSE